MAKLVLFTANDPDALLRAAAAPFCAVSPSKDLPLLALRQGGLRDAVHELAARSGSQGWLGKPILVFDELPRLFEQASAPLHPLERRAILESILGSRTLEALGTQWARPGIIDGLDSLFGNLIAEGINLAALKPTLAQPKDDAWTHSRNADIVAIYKSYLETIATLEPLRGLPRADGRDALRVAADAIRAAGAELPALRRPLEKPAPRSIDILGLADLRNGWRPFLEALRDSPAVDELRIYVLGGSSEVADWAQEKGAELRPIPTASTRVVTPVPTVTAAPDVTREIESVARRIKALLITGDDQGNAVEPRHIAVIARGARPYLTQAAGIFERYGIPVYARLRHTVSEVPAIAALLALFRDTNGGWGLAGYRRISDSPYFDAALDIGLLIEAAGRTDPKTYSAWRRKFDALLEEAGEDDDPETLTLRAERIERAQRELERVVGETVEMEDWLSLSGWIERTLEMIGGENADTVGFLGFAANVYRHSSDDSPPMLLEASRVDAAALRALAGVLVAWRDAVKLGPEREMFSEEWANELERVLADHSVSVRTGERGGVHLSEATAAEGQSWPHVFVLGMSAGVFPADEPRDPFGLELEPAELWRAREDALWRSIAGAASASLHLSYAYADSAGSPQLRSAYLDDVVDGLPGGESAVTTIAGSSIAPQLGQAIWSADEALRVAALATRRPDGEADVLRLLAAASESRRPAVEQFLHATAMERDRALAREAAPPASRLDSAHPFNGRIDDPELIAHLARRFGDRVWSASQLESYGRCGFAFFGKYVLRAHELDEQAEDELSARERGSIIHDALAVTYDTMIDEELDDPLSQANKKRIVEILGHAVRDAYLRAGFALTGTVLDGGLLVARVHETSVLLWEYIQWEIAQNEKAKDRVRPLYVELSFGLPDSVAPAVELKVDDRTLKLCGRIDRIDEVLHPAAEGYYAVVDHKTSSGSLSPVGKLRGAGAVLQLGLYLAALDQILPEARVWGGSYQIVGDRKRVAPLEPFSIDNKGKLKSDGKKQQEADAMIRSAARTALSLVDGVLAGRFAARVPDGTDCPSYCSMRTACREEHMGGMP